MKLEPKIFISFEFIDITANLRIPLRAKSEKIERNGEHYVQIKSIDASVQILGDFKMNMGHNSIIPELVRSDVREVKNSKWMQLKPQIETQIEKHVSDIVLQAITPIFAKVPIQSFFL